MWTPVLFGSQIAGLLLLSAMLAAVVEGRPASLPADEKLLNDFQTIQRLYNARFDGSRASSSAGFLKRSDAWSGLLDDNFGLVHQNAHGFMNYKGLRG